MLVYITSHCAAWILDIEPFVKRAFQTIKYDLIKNVMVVVLKMHVEAFLPALFV